MSTATFIFTVLCDFIYCEFIWWIIVAKNYDLKVAMSIVKMIIYLNVFLILIGGGIAHFISVYFLSLYYIVIYKQRLYELKQTETDGPVA